MMEIKNLYKSTLFFIGKVLRFTATGVALIFIAFAAYMSFSTAGRAKIIPHEAVFFSPSEVPSELVDVLSGKQVVLLGETHYVQEHLDFIPYLVAELQKRGARFLLQESSHAFSWIVEDYTAGRRDTLPGMVERFEGEFIHRIRLINENLPEEDRIRYRYFDMNHGIDAFHYSIAYMAGEAPISPVVAEVLLADPRSREYVDALTALQRRLESGKVELGEKIPALWRDRLKEIVEIELRSIPVRKEWDDHAREQILIDLSVRTIEESRENIVLINTGMFHAQKRRYMGTHQQWLGEFLAESPELTGGTEGLYSLAFFGFEGERIRTFLDADPFQIRPASRRIRWNIVRQMEKAVADAVKAHGKSGSSDTAYPAKNGMFLDLGHPQFSRYAFIAFTDMSFIGRPGAQFDGYFVYPEISVRRDLLEWNRALQDKLPMSN